MRRRGSLFPITWSTGLLGLLVCFQLHLIVGQSNSSELDVLSKAISNQLYQKYFGGENASSVLDGLEHLMKDVGLLTLDHDHEEHKDDHNHTDHEHSEEGLLQLPFNPANFYVGNYNSCLSAERLVAMFPASPSPPAPSKLRITAAQFTSLCPILLNQIDSKVCKDAGHEGQKGADWRNDSLHALKVWGFSFTAVMIISLAGLVVVAIIPIMHKSFYNILSQFLIALAVGSLAGDALLHLMPHALVPHEVETSGGVHEHGSSHSTVVWKALVALFGIHLFFFTERLTILCQNSNSRRKMKRRRHEDFDALEARNSHISHREGEKERGHWSDDSHHDDNHHNHKTSRTSIGSQPCNQPTVPQDNATCPDAMDLELCSTTAPGLSLNNGMSRCCYPPPPPNDDKLADDSQHKSLLLPCPVTTTNQQQHQHLPPASSGCVANSTAGDGSVGGGGAVVNESLTHPHRDKPHGHHHGHSHDLSSVRAIAYTVIAGDGLHNFCDGIAIGAAFANDLRGGLSTSIAVLCHELPHELGDFAVLLHAGMAVKTAVFYNLLSSILCGLGMILGVLLGRIEQATSWIFMLTAGMFLYIALVDMMPELSTSRLKGNIRCHRPSMLFLWQNIGFIIGSGIMLIIALFEDHIL